MKKCCNVLTCPHLAADDHTKHAPFASIWSQFGHYSAGFAIITMMLTALHSVYTLRQYICCRAHLWYPLLALLHKYLGWSCTNKTKENFWKYKNCLSHSMRFQFKNNKIYLGDADTHCKVSYGRCLWSLTKRSPFSNLCAVRRINKNRNCDGEDWVWTSELWSPQAHSCAHWLGTFSFFCLIYLPGGSPDVHLQSSGAYVSPSRDS